MLNKIARSMFIISLLLLRAGAVFAQGIADLGVDQVPGSEFAAAVNLAGKNIKVEGRIFVPDSAHPVRTVIVITNYTLSTGDRG